MKRFQKGEVTLLVIVMAGMMIGMMTWMISGHMGMGHSAGHDEPAATEQQAKAEPPQPSASKAPEHPQ